MRSLWERMLAQWLGRAAEAASADMPEIAIRVRRHSGAVVGAAPGAATRSAEDPVPVPDTAPAEGAAE